MSLSSLDFFHIKNPPGNEVIVISLVHVETYINWWTSIDHFSVIFYFKVIFGSTVLLMLWLPVRVIRRLMPSFLPYNAVLNSDAAMSELSLELLLLQVVLPALLEQGHTRAWLKGVVRGWTIGMAWILDLRSYLIGDIPLSEQVTLFWKFFLSSFFGRVGKWLF